jgi:protein-disulfide isomerase
MTRLLAVAVVLAACSSDNRALEQRLDALSKQIEKLDQKVSGGARQQPARARRPEPDPKTVFSVPVDGNASVGPADALVTIVEGYEYACPACQTARSAVAQVKEKYGDKVRIVYKNYIVHPDQATLPALAACAATKQNRFEAMDRLLWEKGYANKRDFSPANLEAIAKEAELDLARYKTDIEGDCKQMVQRDHAQLLTVGQGATPTFFINGRYMVGAGSLAKFSAVIDEELALAEQRIKDGTPRMHYYQTWIVEKGARKFEPQPAS